MGGKVGIDKKTFSQNGHAPNTNAAVTRFTSSGTSEIHTLIGSLHRPNPAAFSEETYCSKYTRFSLSSCLETFQSQKVSREKKRKKKSVQ